MLLKSWLVGFTCSFRLSPGSTKRRRRRHFRQRRDNWPAPGVCVPVLEDRTLLSVGNELMNYRLAIAATAEYTAFMGGQDEALAPFRRSWPT